MTNYTIPEDIPDNIQEKISNAINRAELVTVEDRRYALDQSEFDDGQNVRTDRSNLPYVIEGQVSVVDDVAVSVDDGCTPIHKGDDYVRIGIQLTTRPSHFKESEKDIASRVYDAMSTAGISSPENDPRVGVQFGSGVVAVENVVSLNDSDSK